MRHVESNIDQGQWSVDKIVFKLILDLQANQVRYNIANYGSNSNNHNNGSYNSYEKNIIQRNLSKEWILTYKMDCSRKNAIILTLE